MNNFSESYIKILEVLRDLGFNANFKRQIRSPKLSDLELIAINLTAEYLSIDSECQLFRILPESLFTRIERSVYNRRKISLAGDIENIRKQLSKRFKVGSKNYFFSIFDLKKSKNPLTKFLSHLRNTLFSKISYTKLFFIRN